MWHAASACTAPARRPSSCRTSTCYNSHKVRLAVLQGLLDTDGGPVTQTDRTCRIQYTTTSPRLRDDVIFLVRSLGGVAYHRTRPAPGAHPGLAKGRPVLTATTRTSSTSGSRKASSRSA